MLHTELEELPSIEYASRAPVNACDARAVSLIKNLHLQLESFHLVFESATVATTADPHHAPHRQSFLQSYSLSGFFGFYTRNRNRDAAESKVVGAGRLPRTPNDVPTRGACKQIKTSRIVRTTREKIRVLYNSK
ncbi:Uncharacterized protein Fot_18885 [Forsythia ovata]|uniref:Uncharacterized protein n=1 Tax=Forsythia ovata TaxID=205694 RepID=A0ABD1VJG1_9LAMI